MSAPVVAPGQVAKILGGSRRVGARWGLVYLLLYFGESALGSVPGLGWLGEAITAMWRKVVPWVGAHVLRLAEPITIFPGGSGDTTFNYVHIACIAVIALTGALGWCLSDRAAVGQARAEAWLRMLVRYTLGAAMLGYGIEKVLHQQMSFPSHWRMIQTYGDSSPMGLLWTFIGYSAGYSFFAGLAEMAGGGLLFFRRTTTLGALLVAGIMANVVMMNLCYDVPVKIYSTHLLVGSVVLVWPDLRRLADLLVWHRPTQPANFAAVWPSVFVARATRVIKVLLIVAILGDQVWPAIQRKIDAPVPVAIHGLYEVESFVRDGEAVPPLLTDKERWQWFIVMESGLAYPVMMDRARPMAANRVDEKRRTLTLRTRDDPPRHFQLRWNEIAPGRLRVEGLVAGRQLAVELKRRDPESFTLVNRGFRWISERPFNR